MLVKKEAFRWIPEATVAFTTLQNALSSAHVLQLPDFAKGFIFECDASGSGIKAILHQGDGPITFFRHAITPCHAKLAAYEKELIGLVQAI